MTKQSWIVTDVDDGIYLSDFELGPTDFTGEQVRGLRVRKHVLRGGLSDGVDVVEIENGTLRATILPSRGMGIHRVTCGDVELGWRSPVHGPVHPQFVNLHEPGGIGWLSGFDEWLCRCGLESNGGPEWDEAGRLKYPLHGRIANLPARRVEVSVDGHAGEITLTGIVDETRLFGRKLRLVSTVRVKAGEPVLHITDEVHNLSSEPTDFELLYHINFGLPLLRPGTRLVAAAVNVVPNNPHSATDVARWSEYGEPQSGLAEFVHFYKLAENTDGQTAVLLRVADDRGVALRYDAQALPCFTQWKCLQPAADGYVTGLEPGTNFPNGRSFEERQERTVKLAGGESRRFALSAEVLSGPERVAAVEQEIATLAGTTPPRVFDRPQPGWSP